MPILSTDPLGLKLTDGDLTIGPRGFETVSGADGVGQLCEVQVRLFLGEWFRNTGKGVDWFSLFQSKFDAAAVRAQVVRAILSVPATIDVTSVKVSIDPSRRSGLVQAAVTTLFGDLPLSVLVSS